MRFIEVYFWKIAKWLIRRGYGADCETYDLDDFPEAKGGQRCPSCRARDIIDWIDENIRTIKN